MEESCSPNSFSSAKGPFISRLNPDSPPFEPASLSSPHHFQETCPMEVPSANHSPVEENEGSPPEELLSREGDDILGNQSLLKQTIRPGVCDSRPPRNSIATVSYSLFLVSEGTGDVRLIERVSNESFIVGEYDILPAIDITIQLMDRGEEARIDADIRHCYGDLGEPEKSIPPVQSDSSSSPYRMRIDLQFHQWTSPPEISTLSIVDRLAWGEKKRQRGNFCFRRRDYSTALQCYRHAIRYLDVVEHPLLEEEEEETEKDHQALLERFIQVKNNLGQVYLLTGQNELCLETIDDVLRSQPKNVKALFRQAKGLFQLGRYEETLQPLKVLLNLETDEVEKDKVNDMLKICRTKLDKYHKNEKEIYRRMFQSTPLTEVSSPARESSSRRPKSKNSWWPYVAMGSALLAAIGLAAIIKSR